MKLWDIQRVSMQENENKSIPNEQAGWKHLQSALEFLIFSAGLLVEAKVRKPEIDVKILQIEWIMLISFHINDKKEDEIKQEKPDKQRKWMFKLR